jgi:hypothetical protein
MKNYPPYRSSYKTLGYRPTVRRIIGVDGEGDNIPDTGEKIEPQAYTLLAFSDDSGYSGVLQHDGSRTVNARTGVTNYGLTTVQCLEFLLAIKTRRTDLLVGFAITYDATMILRDLSVKQWQEIADTHKTLYGKYLIEHIPKQFLRVADTTRDYVNERGQVHYLRDVKVWDTFACYQTSFVTVLENAAEGVLDADKVAFIADMKSKRSDLASQSVETVQTYCLAECEYLANIFRDLLVQLDRAGYAINRYYGPGPVVMKFFESINLKAYMADIDYTGYVGGMPEVIPLRAYYGGRFEISKVGFCGNGWNNDLNSAYPAAMIQLPCLKHGVWERVTQYTPGYHGFYKVGSKTTGQWSPFPFRVGKHPKRGEQRTSHHAPEGINPEISEGSILYAHGGIRWVGHDEVRVALKHFPADSIPIFDGWIWKPSCKHRPFAKVADLYARRLTAKANADGIEKAYKLIINSGYGKTAQGIGWTVLSTHDEIMSDRDGYKPPKYQSYPWAAWTTSYTRAAVTDVALSHPNSVISIATDGIITTEPLKELTVSKKLGDWDEKEITDIWLGRPGIYTYNSVGETPKEDFKRRGFSAKHFPADYLRDSWRNGNWNVTNMPEEGFDSGDSEKTMRAFVPLRQALKRKDIRENYGKWVPISKTLTFYPIKRVAYASLDSHDGTVVDSEPWVLSDDDISLPYKPKQTWEDLDNTAFEDADMYYLESDDSII